jgi:large subunit ribosomal protein L4
VSANTVDVFSTEGEKIGSVELPAEIFDVPANMPLMHQVVVAQLAAARAGTHKTKTRGEVAGGGRKPYKQKGTGRARQGSIRASQWVGGGKAMGPKPRDHEYHVPKKVRKAALRAAISKRNQDKALLVVDSWTPAKPSTKEAVSAFAKLGIQSALVLGMKDNQNLFKSVRNAKKYQFLPVEGANVYDILRHQTLLLTKDAAAALSGVLA